MATSKYCFNYRHSSPCPQPCGSCAEECNPEDYQDSEVNKQRTAEWEARNATLP